MENSNKRVKMVREALNMNMATFAKEMGVRPQNVSTIEMEGASNPSADFLTRLANTYKVNLNWLLTGEGEMFLDGKTPTLTNLPIKVKEVKTLEVPVVANVSFLEKQVLWLQGMIEKLQRENELLIAK